MTNSSTKPPPIPVNMIIFVGFPLAALLLVPARGIYRGYDGFQWLWALEEKKELLGGALEEKKQRLQQKWETAARAPDSRNWNTP